MHNELFRKLTFIGRGSAFAEMKRNSFYFTHGRTLYVFECNMDTFDYFKNEFVLDVQKKDLTKVVICISHMHEDHVGGLATFLMYLQFICGYGKDDVNIVTGDTDTMKKYLDITAVGNIYKNIQTASLSDSGIDILTDKIAHKEGMNCYSFKVDYVGDGDFIYTGDCNNLPDEIVAGVRNSIYALVTDVTRLPNNPVHLQFSEIVEKLGKLPFRENKVKFTHFDSPSARWLIHDDIHKLLDVTAKVNG